MPKQKVKTLVVIPTNREIDIIADQVEAARWSCLEKSEILVVDDVGNLEDLPCEKILSIYQRTQKKRIPTPYGYTKAAFRANEGIRHALESKLDFDMVMVLDDDALPIGQGLDRWALEVFKQNPKAGMIGVMDDVKACANYLKKENVIQMMKQMSEWKHVGNIVPPKETIFYAVNFQSRALVENLWRMGFYGEDMERWVFPCETFQSWVTAMTGFELLYWGRYPNEMKPPLYSMHHGSVRPEDPRKIDKEFLVHHSVRQVEGVDEWEIRMHYKKLRERQTKAYL